MTKTPKQSAAEQWAAHKMARVKMWRSVREECAAFLEDLFKVVGVVVAIFVVTALVFGATAGFKDLVVNREASKAEAKKQAERLRNVERYVGITDNPSTVTMRTEVDILNDQVIKVATLGVKIEGLRSDVESLKPKPFVIPWYPPITNYQQTYPLFNVQTNGFGTNTAPYWPSPAGTNGCRTNILTLNWEKVIVPDGWKNITNINIWGSTPTNTIIIR